jgi:serine/threonine protein phosphatase PrpC
MKPVPIYSAALTDPAGRPLNEDAVYACDRVPWEKRAERGHLDIVADGTGGQAGGQTASAMAATIVAERFYDETTPDIGESLKNAILTAHEALCALAERVNAWKEMSTTIVAAVLHESTLYVAHVGDSRAYLLRKGEARLLTRDHVWLRDDENYGSLTRWLGGGRRSVEVDLLSESLQENDIVVLCSDGLTDVVDREDIGAITTKMTPKRSAQQLIALANHRGTGDNVSVVVIRYGGKAPVVVKWPWVAGIAGGVISLGLLAALLLSRPGGAGGTGTPTPTLPGRLQGVPLGQPTPTATVALVPTQVTRLPTSTPRPPTPTFTPAPTQLRPTQPPVVASPTPPPPPAGGEQPPPPPPPPPSRP